MNKLCCDICGGTLVMQFGGQIAICDSCGMQYSVERVREKVQEITGTVQVAGPVQARQTGTEDDVAQWRTLVQKYYSAGDFKSAEQIVKKILEALPADAEANQMYDELQVLKFVEVKNGVLVKYTGLSETLQIPDCVKIIADRAFEWCSTLKHVHIPTSVTRIGSRAFYSTGLQSLHIPNSITCIGSQAFDGCNHLESVTIPDHFDDKYKASIFGDEDWDSGIYSSDCPWYNRYCRDMKERQQIEWRKKEGLCQHCGSKFTSGLFGPIKCKNCGREKDY